MPQHDHPFIDIVARDGVRARFLAGDALVLLSDDLERIVWANGPGAVLFGFDGVEGARGAQSGLSFAARRQIAATSGFPRIGSGRAMMVRMPHGMLQLLGSAVALPAGETAILLARPAQSADLQDAISGIADDGSVAAIFDADGSILAASDGFAALGFEAATLAGIARRLASEQDRLLKEPVSVGDLAYPAGIVRLADDPARMLIIAVDAPIVTVEPVAAPGRRATQASTAFSDDTDNWYFADMASPAIRPIQSRVPEAISSSAERKPVVPKPVDNSSVQSAADDRMLASESADRSAYTPPEPAVSKGPSARDEADDARLRSEQEPQLLSEEPETTEPANAVERKPGADRAPEREARFDDGGPVGDEPSLFDKVAAVPPSSAETGRPSAAAVSTDEPRFTPDLQSGPVRFVWKTDAEGRFSAVSESFATAVGSAAASVVGRGFRDVADAFGLDPDGEIAALLDRRDTWSGRTVMWPVEATDLRVPVDLAALPVYARDRSFEGFRGFGVVRVGDAVVDADAAGLSLASSAPAAPARPAAPPDPFNGELPAIAVDDTPERRRTDKVIRLAEHRSVSPDKALSATEATAFREIGARLKEAESAERGVKAANENGVRTEPASTGHRAEMPSADEKAASAEPHVDEVETDEPADLEAVARELGAMMQARDDAGDAPAVDDDLPGRDVDDEQSVADPQARAEDLILRDMADDDEAQSDLDLDAEPDGDLSEEAGAGLDHDADGDDALRRQAAARYAAPSRVDVDTSILARLPVPVLIHSGDTLHYANAEFLDLTGYVSLLELRQAGGIDAIFADTPTDPDDQRRRLRTRDGHEFPVEALLQSVPWQGRKALLLAIKPAAAPPPAAASDPEALAELESRVAEMSTILDTATDGIVIITRDGTIRSISQPAEALFGFNSADVAGKPFSSLFAVESQRAARDYLAGLSDHGVASVLNDGREVIGREAQGRFIPMFMTIGKLPSNNGYCAVLRDITQWKRAEEELTNARAEAERASSQKTDFLARISHEIRTPLNAIIGFSELMIDEKFGPIVNDRYKDYLRDINRSGNHVLDLVNDLLDISKIEAGEQEMSYEAVSLNEALAETVALMQPQANRNRVIIRSSFASRLPEVVADLRSVRQIALNLLSNAVRYTQPGGQVIVSTAYEPSGDVIMRVRDTGVGMSSGEIEQALKPFKQINALKRQRGDGTGLGLPLTKAMVEANRARFLINSQPGEGTLVEVVFPSTRVLAG